MAVMIINFKNRLSQPNDLCEVEIRINEKGSEETVRLMRLEGFASTNYFPIIFEYPGTAVLYGTCALESLEPINRLENVIRIRIDHIHREPLYDTRN